MESDTYELNTARRWILAGRVQGVGFRPFVYRLARQGDLTGWVKNSSGIVEILAQGQSQSLSLFQQNLIDRAPDLSRPEIQFSSAAQFDPKLKQFKILGSDSAADSCIHIPPDLFVCDDCLRELNDPADRRYRYPFINCTQCGPRYTLIQSLPYDRRNTTMAPFKLCDYCQVEYTDPGNRRFHAEPVACPQCGPTLEFKGQSSESVFGNEAALRACVEFLSAGKTIAVRGVGGYHLMCDARSDQAVDFLRQNKPRPDKPLAVMFPSSSQASLWHVNQAVNLSVQQTESLLSAVRPVVLATKRKDFPLSKKLAPGLNELGVMLPYSPLHHLLLNDFAAPLVATSANISGEPVLIEPVDVESRLSHAVHGWLHHDRPIHRPIDDAVFRQIGEKARPIRLGRGIAPLEIELPFEFPRPTLAVGGHMKNTIALGWENRVVISPHIGEMNNARSIRLFESTISELQRLYDISAEIVIYDAHPGYASTRWAKQSRLPTYEVFHHHAHAAASCDLNSIKQHCLAFTWDGTGFGEDGHLWGGETFFGRPGNWQRVATFRSFRLPGGERASREPWRSAASLCWETGRDYPQELAGIDLLKQAWEQNLNAPITTAVGRIFDAAAALTGLCRTASFEGQGPMMLESVANSVSDGLLLPIKQAPSGVLETDWEPLVAELLRDNNSVQQQAAMMHATLANDIVRKTKLLHTDHDFTQVTLSGGVFQNRVLTELAVEGLEEAGFSVYLSNIIPLNDAGLSFGQLIEYSHSYESL